MTGAARLAGLVASRICHDLISPVGAIGNGLELMREPGGDAEALALVEDSAAAAADALRFLRLAFGARDPEERIGRAEIEAALAGWFVRRKVSTELGAAPAELPFRAAQPLLLLALAAASAAPRGGRLALEKVEADPLAVVWRVEAEPLRPPPRLLALLDGTAAAQTPAEAHLFLLRLLGDDAGARLHWAAEGRIGLS